MQARRQICLPTFILTRTRLSHQNGLHVGYEAGSGHIPETAAIKLSAGLRSVLKSAKAPTLCFNEPVQRQPNQRGRTGGRGVEAHKRQSAPAPRTDCLNRFARTRGAPRPVLQQNASRRAIPRRDPLMAQHLFQHLFTPQLAGKTHLDPPALPRKGNENVT